MNGLMKLPLYKGGRRHYTVFGGPFAQAPITMATVKMAAEIRMPCSVSIPTIDFSVPSKAVLDEGLYQAVKMILHGDPVYVGCMGGRGRTGLFLAILAKAFKIDNPVEYVRQHYYAHAVETAKQYQYVQNYEIPNAVEGEILIRKILEFPWIFGKADMTRVPMDLTTQARITEIQTRRA